MSSPKLSSVLAIPAGLTSVSNIKDRCVDENTETDVAAVPRAECLLPLMCGVWADSPRAASARL